MVKAPTSSSMVPAGGGPAGVRRIHPGPEIAMNPRNLPTASANMPMRGDANAVGRTTPVYYPQVQIPIPLTDRILRVYVRRMYGGTFRAALITEITPKKTIMFIFLTFSDFSRLVYIYSEVMHK